MSHCTSRILDTCEPDTIILFPCSGLDAEMFPADAGSGVAGRGLERHPGHISPPKVSRALAVYKVILSPVEFHESSIERRIE